MTGRKAVCGAVKADVERGFAVVDKVADALFVRDLCNEAAGLQFFVNTHVVSFLSIFRFWDFWDNKKAPLIFKEGNFEYKKHPHLIYEGEHVSFCGSRYHLSLFQVHT